MFERVWHMMLKEFLQIFRDVRLRTVILLMPLLQTIIFGYAINIDVRDIRLAVLDQDQSAASRNFVHSLVNSGYFILSQSLEKESQIAEQLDQGRVSIVLQIRSGFESSMKVGDSHALLAIIDGSDANTASIVRSYITRVAAQQALAINPVMSRPQAVRLQSRAWFNETLISRNFYIPGLIGILLTLTTLTLTSMSIVREKEIGTMEQLIVTPINRVEFIAGKTLPYILIGLFNVIGILFVSAYWFEVPIRGNLVLLFVAISLYLLTTLGIGLFVSTISNTQQEAMLSAFMFYFPLVLLSGFIFPVYNMPKLIQWLSVINPLKYFLVIIRGIFLKGIGVQVLWPELLALMAIGLVVFWQAIRRFHKTLS